MPHPTSCSKRGQRWGQARLLTDLLIWDLKISATSPGKLFQCSIIPTVGKFSFIASLNIPRSSLYLLSPALAPLEELGPTFLITSPQAWGHCHVPRHPGAACPSPYWDFTRSPLWLLSPRCAESGGKCAGFCWQGAPEQTRPASEMQFLFSLNSSQNQMQSLVAPLLTTWKYLHF